jgi:hypothetical protein
MDPVPRLLALATLALVPALARAEAPPVNVVLIGWDGAQREHVRELLDAGRLPTLKRLATEGRLVRIDIRGTTDTKAGWTQILTGYDPDVTGVFSNQRFQTVPAGLSLFEQVEARHGSNAVATVAVIGKKEHCGDIDPPKKVEIPAEEAQAIRAQAARPKQQARDALDDQAKPAAAKRVKRLLAPGTKIVQEGDRWFKVTPGKPYVHMAAACDVWDRGLLLDEKVGAQALALLEKHRDRPFLFFVHFAEVDHRGHRAGENSPDYEEGIVSNDRWTGRILEKLAELGLADRTLVYVTADHGFDEGKTTHHKAPTVFLATNDRAVCRDGDRADVTPTIYDALGLDLAAFAPPLAGHSLRRPLPGTAP